jgi:hypothetical protein
MKILVERDSDELSALELFLAFETESGTKRDDLRKELLKRLSPKEKAKPEPVRFPGMPRAKKGA